MCPLCFAAEEYLQEEENWLAAKEHANLSAKATKAYIAINHQRNERRQDVCSSVLEGSPTLNIFSYLCSEASEISEGSLSDIETPAQLTQTRKERWRAFVDMLGLTAYINARERPPVETKTTGTIERGSYRIEKLYFESLPKLYVTGNLYVPRSSDGPAPAVLYLCGHALNQKHHYQAHARKLAELGFATLVIETTQRGEIRGRHHSTYHHGLFRWHSLGYTPAGVEVWNAVRAIDLIQSMKVVDPNRIGVTGISGGGAMSWFTAAIDERVKVAAPVCGTATVASHVSKRTLEGHCDCMFWVNTHMWDLADVGALIAPRPLLIASAVRDWIFDIDSVRLIYRKLRHIYEVLGVPENIILIETPGGHSYDKESRRMVFQWFLKHLKGADATLEDIGDIDESPQAQETIESLRVFTTHIPADEKVTTVHEWLIEPKEPPDISISKEIQHHRDQLVQNLLKYSFTAFPRKPCNLETEVELVQESEDWIGIRLAFTPEEGWRLHAQVLKPVDAPESTSLLVFLAKNARNLYFGDKLVAGLDKRWARAFVETRGIGETSWSQDLQWFIRRASMLTGRTIASMRIYDAHRALEALESLKWADKKKMAILGSGEMAAVSLYAALIRKDISAVILHDPPSTQNAPSNPDGTGPAIEILNCLRYTDLPYVAGLLWPAQLVFLGPRPDSYNWAEELYAKLGEPGRVSRMENLSQWNLRD